MDSCAICSVSPSHCNNLHIFYLIGSILTMGGCLFVLITVYILLIILSISVNNLCRSNGYEMVECKPSKIHCFIVWDTQYKDENDSQLKDENVWHYLFALTVAFLGVNTLLVWLYRQFILHKSKQQNKTVYAKIANLDSLKPKRKSSLRMRRSKHVAKNFIAPALPEHIAFVQSDHDATSTGDAQDSKCKTCCNRLSLKPTIGDKSINKALRREVLAYSTDGIAQSIDRQTKMDQTFYTKETFRLEEGVLDEDYPQSMNDPHGRTIQIFCIVIKYNRHLLYEEGANADSTSDADDSKKAIKKKPNHLELAADLAGSEDAEKPDLPRVHTKMIIGKDNTFGKGREFVDFAPIVFKYIRNHVLGISDKDYKASMIPTDKYAQRNVLDAKFGEGKSGAFFYFSHDSRYLVKTIKKFEVEVMLDTLKQYVQCIVDNPNTILSRV
eukprot:827141_1